MPLGVHTSIAGGLHLSVERALELGCDAMQIFSRNPRSWAYAPIGSPEAALFKAVRQKSGIRPVVVHTTYLINLCATDDEIYAKSIGLFKGELANAEALGAEYLVTHLGSPQDMGAEFAFKRITGALSEAVSAGLGKKTAVLFENTAGGGFSFGSNLAEIGRLIAEARSIGLYAGLCLDTCHAFAAGYPLDTEKDAEALVRRIDAEAGLENLKVIHLNDSKGAFNSRIDRHEHIGKGRLGSEALKAFLTHPAIRDIPMILETPKKTPGDDPMNLKTVREILTGL